MVTSTFSLYCTHLVAHLPVLPPTSSRVRGEWLNTISSAWSKELSDEKVEVTIMDLPQQLEMMKQKTENISGHERIHGHGVNLLDFSEKQSRN